MTSIRWSHISVVAGPSYVSSSSTPSSSPSSRSSGKALNTSVLLASALSHAGFSKTTLSTASGCVAAYRSAR